MNYMYIVHLVHLSICTFTYKPVTLILNVLIAVVCVYGGVFVLGS